MPILFTTTTKTARLRAVFKGLSRDVNSALQSKHITYYLKKSITDRFETAGANRTAQTAPSGRRWDPMGENTMRGTRESQDTQRALYNTGTLMRSIRVLYSRVSKASLNSSKGGGFIIGVGPSSPAYKYAAFLQKGGTTPTGGDVPGRRFLGVSKEDTAYISKFLKEAVEGGFR